MNVERVEASYIIEDRKSRCPREEPTSVLQGACPLASMLVAGLEYWAVLAPFPQIPPALDQYSVRVLLSAFKRYMIHCNRRVQAVSQ